jgi:peroxiredoxin
LLDRGPLALALFRGGWCPPYCDLTMVALEQARPAIEALGAEAVGIMPEWPEQIAATARQRDIGYLLLSDPANLYARTCGLAYELSPNHILIHRERRRNFPTLHGDTAWRLPVPAVFVARPDARMTSIRRAGPIPRS